MAEEALKIWMKLPADIRSKLLSNVWCPDCRTAVTICDYSADLDGGVVSCGDFGKHRESAVTVSAVRRRGRRGRIATIA